VIVSLSSSLRILSPQGAVTREIPGYGWAGASPAGALATGQDLWVADASVGLVSTTNYTDFRNHTIDGPYTANVADIVFSGNSFSTFYLTVCFVGVIYAEFLIKRTSDSRTVMASRATAALE